MAVTNLTNTTWAFNETISNDGVYHGNWDIEYNSEPFSNRDGIFDKFYFSGSISYASTKFQGGNPITVYGSAGVWYYSAAKTITITGGEDVTSGTLIAFLEANATQVIKTTINDQLTRIENAKADIISAIREKGVEVPEGTLLSDMASYIAAISDTNYRLVKSEDGSAIILRKTDEEVSESTVLDNDTIPEAILDTELNTILTD